MNGRVRSWVLQVLLSQVHRLRALVLLGRFLDMGAWAVDLALSGGWVGGLSGVAGRPCRVTCLPWPCLGGHACRGAGLLMHMHPSAFLGWAAGRWQSRDPSNRQR
jgi:hypothetical protein